MLVAVLDHLWQSTGFFAGVCLLAFMTRRNAAIIRLWLWRTAAVKFLVPFAALFALGAWLGYPVATPNDSAPGPLLEALRLSTPLLAPAHSHSLESAVILTGVVIAPLAAAAGLYFAFVGIGREHARVLRESLRVEHDPDAAPPALGFFKAALLTLLAISAAGAPLLGGAVQDRQQRRNLLIIDSLALRSATIRMQTAAPGMGTRVRWVAHPRGVLIRNANIQALVSAVYGVSPHLVWTNQLAVDSRNHWLLAPRYDIEVLGPIRDPRKFEPYALRQPVTQLLAERFGLETYRNGKCQPPCGRYGVAMPADPL